MVAEDHAADRGREQHDRRDLEREQMVEELLDDSVAASESWGDVLRARGQIIQDGFPPDLRVAETRLARAAVRAGKD